MELHESKIPIKTFEVSMSQTAPSEESKKGFQVGTGSKQIKSANLYVPPGTVQHHSSGQVSLETLAEIILQDARVTVANDVQAHVYQCGIDLTLPVQYINGDWFSLIIHQEYRGEKRIFSARLENWSADWGRWFQIVLTRDE